jgi:hypothetical protein
VRHKISFPGAERLEITFDDRCRTETGCDYLQFFDSGASISMVGRSNSGRNSDSHWPGVNGVPALVHIGSSLEARFRSDGSVNDWGYLFTVRAHYPEVTAGDIQSFPHVSVVLKSSIESIVVDAFFAGHTLTLPKSFLVQAQDKSCISRCFLSHAGLKRVQTGIVASVEHIMSKGLVPSKRSPRPDLSPLVAALSVVSPNYLVVGASSAAIASSQTVPQQSPAFSVGDKVRLVNPVSRPATSAEVKAEAVMPPVIMQVSAGAALNVRYMNSLFSGVVGMLKAGEAFAFTHITNGWAKLSPAHYDELQQSANRCYPHRFVSHNPEVAGWCVMTFEGQDVFDQPSDDTKLAIMKLVQSKTPEISAPVHSCSLQPSSQTTKLSSVGGKAAAPAHKSKSVGTVIQVKSTRCVVKGLTGGRPYTFKYDQLERADISHDLNPNDVLSTVAASDISNEPVLLELQHTIVAHIWGIVSAHRADGKSFQELCTKDRRTLHDVARVFGTECSMYHVCKSVGPALLFLRLFSCLATFDHSDDEWSDSSSIQIMTSIRSTLRSVIPLMPRVLSIFPGTAFSRAVAALLFFIIRGNSNGASSASVSRFQLSASILQILQDQIRPYWPVVIEFMYTKNTGRHQDPLDDLILLSACKQLDGSFSEKIRRVFESGHPYDRGSAHQHELAFPGTFYCSIIIIIIIILFYCYYHNYNYHHYDYDYDYCIYD